MGNNNGSASIVQVGLLMLALTNSSFQENNTDIMEPTRSFKHEKPLCRGIYEIESEVTNRTEPLSLNSEDIEKTILSFAQALIENSVNIPAEYGKVVNDNFWDLV